MAAYTAFAEIYDELMDDVDYPGWADYYLRLLARAGVVPRKICDCACGTGSMSIEFAGKGMDVTGVDRSSEMLQRAREKAGKSGVRVMYVCQDICRLALPRPVDALVCACDGVNYLLDDEEIKAFFHCACNALKPGGGLAFDISSAWKLKNILGDGFFGEERENIAYLWWNHWDERTRTVTMDLTFFVRKSDEIYRRFAEEHKQKAHDADHIKALLGDCGFGEIEIFGDRVFNAPAEGEQRIHFLAVRK